MESKVKVPVVIRDTNIREKARFLAGKRVVGNPVPKRQGRSLPNVIVEEPIDFRGRRCPCDREVPAFLSIRQRPDKGLNDQDPKENRQIALKPSQEHKITEIGHHLFRKFFNAGCRICLAGEPGDFARIEEEGFAILQPESPSKRRGSCKTKQVLTTRTTKCSLAKDATLPKAEHSVFEMVRFGDDLAKMFRFQRLRANL
jgi:hypothetical protein